MLLLWLITEAKHKAQVTALFQPKILIFLLFLCVCTH